MKKLKIFLTVLLASLMVLSVNPKYIKADDINVVKEGTKDDFNKNIPIPTAVVDIAKVSHLDNAIVQLENDSLFRHDVHRHNPSDTPGHKEYYNSILYNNATGDLKKGGGIITLEKGYTVTFPDAVLLADGSNADIEIKVSNIRISVNDVSTVEVPEYMALLKDEDTNIWLVPALVSSEFKIYASDSEDVDTNYLTRPRGVSQVREDVEVNIKQNGKIVDCTFVYGVKDLDVKDYTTNDYTGEYAEGIELLEGFNNTVYMPATSKLVQSGNRFRGTEGDNGTYDSGLAVLANSGFKFTWTGSGVTMGTILFDSLEYFTVQNSAVNGTSSVIVDGKKVEMPIVVVRPGDSVTVSTSPNEGFKAKSIRSDGEEQEITDPEFDEFSLTYSNIKSNHIFIAEYEPYTYTINYDAGEGGEGVMTPSVFTYDIPEFMSKDNEFTKDHYKFIGFKLEGKEELITTPEDFREMLVEMGDGAEITLVAQWEYEQITSFIDIETEEVISPEESGQVQPKDIDGYVYIETEADGQGNWVHKYKAVKTNYVDEDGTPLLDPKPGKKESENIPGYKLVKTEDDPKGDTTYTYHKVKTSWVDEHGKVLHPAEDGVLDPKVFPGYKLVKTHTNDKGDTIHTYHHIQTSWVDEKNEKIIPSKDGEHQKETFPNYEFVRSETKENGDLVHHYLKLIDLKFIVDGKVIKEEHLKRGSSGTAPEVLPKTGYKFSGWDKEFKNLQVDTVVTAKLEPIAYPITYVLDGGKNDASNPASYTIEDAITLKNPIKFGARFVGWKEGNSIAKGSTGDKTFTAQWEVVANPVNTGFGNKTALTAVGLVGALSLAIYLSKKKFENK